MSLKVQAVTMLVDDVTGVPGYKNPVTGVDSATFGAAAPAVSVIKTSATYAPAAVAANTTAEQFFGLAGVLSTDILVVNKPSAQAGLGIVNVRAATGNVVITFSNNTAAAITPTAETYAIAIIR